ncbi:unnamed protein product [Diatraea saccharalis]|uniref:Uncharacterized protein n=1 Tax=Diatraea saccharalis TaxID=40085 RepID=A0A9P0G243_9NEOP|nr:unnamed protein product [Diatraea saccharalis]
MISPEGAVSLVQATERHNEAALVGGAANQPRDWLNPSKSLVDHALERWSNTRMRADNTSVVTLMLDPPGPPRATVLRSRTTQKPPVPIPTDAAPPVPAPLKTDDSKPEPATDTDDRRVPRNGLTIVTRYSDVDRPAPSPDAPLPPCATLDARLSVAPPPPPDDPVDTADSDTITNYGDPTESYFMTRLLNRSGIVNTLEDVYDEIVARRLDRRPSDTAPPPDTVLPDADEPDAPASGQPGSDLAGDRSTTDERVDDGRIQINEVSSSSPVEAPPKGRGRRPRAEPRRDASAAAPNDRVLRSHHEEPPRPHTRQAARPRPPPALDRVVILTRRAPPPPPPPPLPPADDEEDRRTTRSQGGAPALAQKITRGLSGVARELRAAAAGARAGNSGRAPGPARRAPAARRQGAPRAHRSKENLGAATRRARAPPPRAAAAQAPCPEPRRRDEPEVHSTTGDPCGAPPPPAPRPRALRSRNETEAPVGTPTAGAGGKRSRCEEGAVAIGGGGGKAPRLQSERCARALHKRASGPWAPALALRNRLRRRLGK